MLCTCVGLCVFALNMTSYSVCCQCFLIHPQVDWFVKLMRSVSGAPVIYTATTSLATHVFDQEVG